MPNRMTKKISATMVALAASASLLIAAPAAAAPTYYWGTSVPGPKGNCMAATDKKIHQIKKRGGEFVEKSICKFSLGWNDATNRPVVYHSTNLRWRY